MTAQQAVVLDRLPAGAVVEFKTGHHVYKVETFSDGKVMMSGHPKYCPEPVPVCIANSLIALGMRVEFRHPTMGEIRTSRVEELSPVKIH